MQQLDFWRGPERWVWYFAYGSNMAEDVFCGWRRMRPSEARWGWLDDHALRFDLPIGPGERGVANVVPCAGARTCGVLWRITLGDFERLDRTEGVQRGVYLRVPVCVRLGSGRRVSALTYGSARSAPGRRPSRRYLGLLLEGAREHGLPEAWLDALRSIDPAPDERLADGRQLALDFS